VLNFRLCSYFPNDSAIKLNTIENFAHFFAIKPVSIEHHRKKCTVVLLIS